jgi:hypothetical protein
LKWLTVIIGVHTATRTVGKIWVHENGSLMFDSVIKLPDLGRTSIGEAITTYGLTKIRRYQVEEVAAAKAYARRLEIELDDGQASPEN